MSWLSSTSIVTTLPVPSRRPTASRERTSDEDRGHLTLVLGRAAAVGDRVDLVAHRGRRGFAMRGGRRALPDESASSTGVRGRDAATDASPTRASRAAPRRRPRGTVTATETVA